MSDWKQYNANTANKHTSDCVARSLSLAFGLDYDEVKRELKRRARERGLLWNQVTNFRMWMFEYAAENNSKLTGDTYSDKTTVEDISKKYNNDTVICLCGDNKSRSSHLVCIINGDIYDT